MQVTPWPWHWAWHGVQRSIHVCSVEDRELDVWKYGWMDGWMDAQKDGEIADRWLDVSIGKRMNGKKERRVEGREGRGNKDGREEINTQMENMLQDRWIVA